MSRLTPLALGSVVLACTPHDGGGTLPGDGPIPAPIPIREPAAIVDDGCALRHGDDPVAAVAGNVQITPLRGAATWTARVDAIGGYDHGVAFDRDGSVFWAHDSKHMRFTLTKFDAAGNQTWHRVLDPEQLSPKVMRTTSKGSVLVAGTAFTDDASGPTMVHIGADGSTLWKTLTPRVGVKAIRELPDGRFAVLGHSGRSEVTLGPDTLRNEWTDVASSMDVLSIVSQGGTFERSTAFIPGAMGMERGTDGIYLAGNFGRASVDYGNGLTAGPGVVAKFDFTGEVAWTHRVEAGLYGVVAAGPDILTFGFSSRAAASMGGPPIAGATAAWIDADGCYRGSAKTGDGLARIVGGTDGSFLAYFSRLQSDHWQFGDQSLSVPQGHWVVAKLTADLELQWARSIECGNLRVGIGQSGQAAVSCFRSLSDVKPLVRRYELLVLEP